MNFLKKNAMYLWLVIGQTYIYGNVDKFSKRLTSTRTMQNFCNLLNEFYIVDLSLQSSFIYESHLYWITIQLKFKFHRFAISSTRTITIDEKPRASRARLSKRRRLFFRYSVVRTSRETRPFWNHGINPFGDIEESNRERTGYRTVQVLSL